MQIRPIDQAAIAPTHVMPASARVSRGDDTLVTGDVRKEKPITEPVVEPEITIADTTDEGDRAEGVLRLLQEGHFKGVADVRLRINFADEIAAMENEQAGQIANEGVDGLLNLVNEQMASLPPDNGLDEPATAGIQEALATFNAALPQVLDEYKSGGGDLPTRLETAFSEFILAVQTAATPVPEPDPVTPVVPADDAVNPPAEAVASIAGAEPPAEEAPSFDFQSFITDLADAYAAKLRELEDALGNVQVLPPLSEPQGNGKAYQKFLDIYNDLRGVPDPEPAQPVIDAIA